MFTMRFRSRPRPIPMAPLIGPSQWPMKTILILIVALGLPGLAWAQSPNPEVPRPLWEIGIGAIGRVSADYPGAEDLNWTVTPIPYVRYRGRLLELGGDDAVRFIPIQTVNFELGFSLDSSARVANRVTSLGASLPDLDRLFEFGPEFTWSLVENTTLLGISVPGQIDAILQTRGVFSFDDTINYEGAVFRPALRYRVYGAVRPGSRIQGSIGPIFATEGVQDVYYEVASKPGEPGYDASGGYLGTELRGAIRLPVTKRTQVIGGAAVSYLGGAENTDSPAMLTDWDATVFLGVTVSILQSSRTTLRDR